ncbi:hypothetical protein Dsin_002088 [Dipteronia sinensis]|uniref:DUF659 domain-containing protein n=1 Tax=Dipteronia sinensis TaxID=43782 RepID=A0AAE0B5G9_9ROSI|nr:hypothetical protein Dsin_002088 [Dipteronia sinensis]
MMNAIGPFGPGYKEPSQYQLSEPLLKKEVSNTNEALKMRSIMNLCVNCMEGTTFLCSKESGDEAYTKEMFQYANKCIEQVGPTNVIQVVTDNASNSRPHKDVEEGEA